MYRFVRGNVILLLKIGGAIMAENVTIQMNMTNGEILIQAPAESLDTIFDKLQAFLPSMMAVHEKFADEDTMQNDASQGIENDTKSTEPSKDSMQDPIVKSGAKKKRSAASKKPESYKMAELGLDEQQRQSFREFYNSKSPKSQNEQILVVMYWLKNDGEKAVLSKDDIYTGLKIVDAKVPARISSVLSNLGIEGRTTSDGDGYHLHHTGEDFVKFDLPKKDGKK